MSLHYLYKLFDGEAEVFTAKTSVSNWSGPVRPEKALDSAVTDIRMYEAYPDRVPIIPKWTKMVVYFNDAELVYENDR